MGWFTHSMMRIFITYASTIFLSYVLFCQNVWRSTTSTQTHRSDCGMSCELKSSSGVKKTLISDTDWARTRCIVLLRTTRPYGLKTLNQTHWFKNRSMDLFTKTKMEEKRLFNHLEGNKYMHKSLVLVYKFLAREVKAGSLNRDLAEPIDKNIEAASKFRSLIFNM